MHNELTESLGIICCGILGISIAMFIKMQDITNANDNLNFKQVAALYFKKAWASYGVSVAAVILYAVTHENWIQIFTGEGETKSHPIITQLIGMVMVMGAMVGFIFQYGYYKLVMKKVDSFMKNWGGNKQDRSRDTEQKSELSDSKPDLSNLKPAAPNDDSIQHGN